MRIIEMMFAPRLRNPIIPALLLAATAAQAQQKRPPTPPAPEFTQQIVLVAPLRAAGPEKVARQVAVAVRPRLARLLNRRDARVLDTDTMDDLLEFSGYGTDTADTRALARRLRADEVVFGVVESRSGTIEVRAEVRLTREWRWRQPLRAIRGATVADVADTLAREIARVRTQMTGVRRCENAARRGENADAARFAEEAIALYPPSALARTCLALVLRFNGVAADSLVHVTDAILRVDSLSIVAAVLRANNLDVSGGIAPVAEAWNYVIKLRPDSLDLALLAVEELLHLPRPGLAVEATRLLAPLHDGDVRIRRLAFRAHVALAAWRDAAALGDSLDAEDAEFRDDSTYAIRHVEALRLTGDTLGALAKSARTVKQHPGDLLLYVQYVKLIGGENGAALPRGVASFPNSPELRVLSARASLSTGKKRDAIASLSAAVTYDSMLTQGFLQIAELWFDEHRPDSALAVMSRAPRTGVNADLLRTYVVGRGRQVARTASDSTPEAWQLAISLFSLADSVESRDDSRGLIAATTLQLARSALVLAAKARDCPDANRANGLLGLTADALTRGVGDGESATELKDAFGAMRSATDNAIRLYCVPPKSP